GSYLPLSQHGYSFAPTGEPYSQGWYIEDYVFTGLGDLDEHNGRCCVTPEYPGGTYAYFTPLDVNYQNDFPYSIGNTYYGVVTGGTTNDNFQRTVTIPPSDVVYDTGDCTLGTWVRAQKITAAPDGQANAHFGTDVAIIGDQAFV